jgi:hypothetical protein
MSGFEVIGVLLGVWPVIVNGLTMYKASKDGRGYGLLLNELRAEEFVYREFVQHLLQADVPEADLVRLTDSKRSNMDLWKDRKLHFSLERRLGREKSHIVLETLAQMDPLLVSLGEKLCGTDDVRFLSNITGTSPPIPIHIVYFFVLELRVSTVEGENSKQHSPNEAHFSNLNFQTRTGKFEKAQRSASKANHKLHGFWLPGSISPSTQLFSTYSQREYDACRRSSSCYL